MREQMLRCFEAPYPDRPPPLYDVEDIMTAMWLSTLDERGRTQRGRRIVFVGEEVLSGFDSS